MRLRLTEVLDYYDVPQIFVALDVVGTQYLCLVYDYDNDGRSLCIASDISKDRLNDVITGHIDLRQVFLEPEKWLYDVVVDGKVIEAKLREATPTEDMLPDEGYYLDFAAQENLEMVRAAQEGRKTIIRLVLNYETTIHSVLSGTLTQTLHNFQALLTNVYKKVNKDTTGINSRLMVRALIPASFDIELEADETTDMFGGSKVADTLNLISSLFGDDDETVANSLVAFKGSAQTNYRNLLRSLSDANISFKYKWVQGVVNNEVEECPVTKERVQSLYSLATSLQPKEERDIIFEGSFFMANTRNGRWGLNPSGEKKAKYGICTDLAKLDGVILKSQLYRVKCVEKTTLNPNTNKEYRSYILADIRKITK